MDKSPSTTLGNKQGIQLQRTGTSSRPCTAAAEATAMDVDVDTTEVDVVLDAMATALEETQDHQESVP